MSEEFRVLVVSRLRWDTIVVPGSDAIRTNCGHHGMIAPTGRRFLADDPGAYIICTECMPRDVMTDPNTTRRSVPGAEAELAEKFGQSGVIAAAIARHVGIEMQ